MKFIYFCIGASLFSLTAFAAVIPPIIPWPQKVETRDGYFRIQPTTKFLGIGTHPGTRIMVEPGAEPTGYYLAAALAKPLGFAPQVVIYHVGMPTNGVIFLTTNAARTNLGSEGYELDVTSAQVVIRAPANAGLFYGVETLLQLLPPQIFATNKINGVAWHVPAVRIEDQPRFPWRGLMLDVARHFFTKPEVEKILDGMALHKMNMFQWHLTDDQGWRIEIKQYPLLTQVGAWRKAIGFKLDPAATTNYDAAQRYGGFYTQEDIREIVAYAQARHITIVPEIEMPGHSCAALAAYPQFSCTGGPYNTDSTNGIFDGNYCPGNEAAFEFVHDILNEVNLLFPGKYIHIGGDEVLPGTWEHCPKCQARMREQGLTNALALEGYFIRRVEKMINTSGHQLVGWSEIREGGLAPSATVMDWIGGAVESASSGHDVVMTPLEYCYFDHYQSTNQAAEPHTIGGFLNTQHVYEYEPIPAKLAPEDYGHIIGSQGNVWTEYIPNLAHAEYMIFPRLCALSEVVWSARDARDWNSFTERLPVDLMRLRQMGINYRREDKSYSQVQ